MSPLIAQRLVDLLRILDRATGGHLRGLAPARLQRFVFRQRQHSAFAALGPRPNTTSRNTTSRYVPPPGLLPYVSPLNIEVSPELTSQPRLNLLLPSTAMDVMTGGPNTALNLAMQLGRLGIPLRLVSTDRPPDKQPNALLQHLRRIAGIDPASVDLEIVDATNRRRPFTIGSRDVFLATAWWTAQPAKYALSHTVHPRFVYLIQDYEPLLHSASSAQALAEETYSFDHIPVINTNLLHEFLRTRSIGRYSDREFADQAMVFEPAVDSNLFFPLQGELNSGGKRRLLFYARPTVAARNLFELGVAALQKLIFEAAIDPGGWEFLGMGEAFEAIPLGRGAELRAAPWLGLEGYARQMQQADVLLSLMLSPHPSYPPLEMAACGKPVVTTTYGNKTAERLAAISPNIIGVPATIDGIAGGLVRAMQRPLSRQVEQPHLGLPNTWSESLSNVVPRLHEALLDLFEAPKIPSTTIRAQKQSPSCFFPGYRNWPSGYYELQRLATLKQRRDLYTKCDSSLFSLITTVWNTAPEFLAELAESVFGQDSGADFEWIVLDNGTSRADTRALLQKIGKHPAVRLHRVDENIGIVKGLRYCLERANNRYILPLDSDDLLTPDCLRIFASSLSAADYPPLAYTDEDKVSGQRFQDPYCKPDWDPVLFVHSCYIAHLCAIDRKLALELGAYTNLEAEGSHDWDSFLRFQQAGHRPHHVAEAVYSWRIHPQSTSGNIKSKSYIHASHQSVLNRFISGSPKPRDYKVELSSLFGGAPDWRFVRSSDDAVSMPTILYGVGLADKTSANGQIVRIEPQLNALLTAAKACAAHSRFVHIQSADVTIDDPTWASEAITLMDLFGDTAIVGGRIHDGKRIVRADCYFGFGGGCDSPNIGRPLQDPGYFAQMWKPHSANAVPLEHCVIRTDFLVEALTTLVETGIGFSYLGASLGAVAKARGLRVVYSPFLSAATTQPLDDATPIEKSAFCIAWARLLPDTALMSPRLGLTVDTAYLPISRDVRIEQERRIDLSRAVDDQNAEAIASRVIARSRKIANDPSLPPTKPAAAASASFSLLTTVWNTDPRYIAALADSISGQDCDVPFEWIVLDNGSVRSDTIEYLSRLGQQGFVRLFRIEKNAGIVGGLRYCLEHARNDYVVPIDSDDILTPGAFRRLSSALSGPARPAYVFSDEDILDNSRLISPIKRSEFDPVLNACDSYVWHLCAFHRSKALELDAYADAGAEYCHDWDTITRFANAGERIEHVPHVLYHWRTHPQSSSNSGSLNSGSMKSTKWLMERTIAKQKDPTLYEVRLFPISRGVDQYAIMRKPTKPQSLCLLYFGKHVSTADIPGTLASKLGTVVRQKRAIDFHSISCPERQKGALLGLLKSDTDAVVVLTEGHEPIDEAGIWDAMLILELHADVAAVAGRITDKHGKILTACTSPAAELTATPCWTGMMRTDPGVSALALKRQTASAIPADYFICRKDILHEAISGKIGLDPASVAERIASIAHTRAMRLAYSPLMEAVRNG